MSNTMTPEQRHRCMSSIPSSSTKPEIVLRHFLWRKGFRYRTNVKSLPGKPDIVMSKYRTVIFVHGCFWHGHEGCNNFRKPKTNESFWRNKIAHNKKRDEDNWRDLEALGWFIIIVWECELKKSLLNETISKVENQLKKNRNLLQKQLLDRRRGRQQAISDKERKKESHLRIQQELKEKYNWS